MITGDPLRDFDRHDKECHDAERKRPRCCICDQPIWDDYLWDIMDALYCEKCMNDRYRGKTEDYIK